MSIDDPLPPEDVAAYLDGRLSGKELDRVEAVLAGSREARDELLDASRLIAGLPARPARFKLAWVLVPGVAAAAVLAVLVVPSHDRSSGSQPIAIERPARADDGTGIRTVVPDDKAIVGPKGIRFLWRGVRGATYQLTVTDPQGRIIWQMSTSDTTLILPEAVTLSRPGSYYWNVDALAPDGSSTTTGIREIRVPTR